MTSISASSSSAQLISDARKTELLQSARRSRLQWVLEARDTHPIPALSESNSPGEERNKIKEEKAADSLTKDSLQKIAQQIPAAQCIQEVLEFFNYTVNDGDNVDLDSILVTIQEEENMENLLENWKNNSSAKSSYDIFIQKLLHPQAAPLVKAIQQFITKFTITLRRNKLSPSSSSAGGGGGTTLKSVEDEIKSQTNSIWTFLDHSFEIMKECALWVEESPKELEDSKINCEKFVFSKLHGILFGNDSNDALLNQMTFQRIESLSFITAEHLDIRSFHGLTQDHKKNTHKSPNNSNVKSSDPVESVLAKPIDYLQRLQSVRCPNDALLALKLCSQSIAQILKDCRSDGKLPGADELLPVMILAIKFANPRDIHSWMKYLQRYTRQSKLVSEAGYLITNFVSAVYFLDNVDANALTISPEEFEESMKLSKQKAKERMAKHKHSLSIGGGGEAGKSGEGEEKLDKIVADYQQRVKGNSQKEYISIKATMSLLQYGKI
jgi:hypothetical protein